MGENIIFYGPPGTGKTYTMQALKNYYTDYYISDEEIKQAYIESSQDWILITLVLLQNGNSMTNEQITTKIQELNIEGYNQPSAVLNSHSITLSELFNPLEPVIFHENDNGIWSVDLNRLMDYDASFIEQYFANEQINKRYVFVTFHQSFTYEDFVEGIRPSIESDHDQEQQNSGDILYEIQDGVFKKLCERAKNDEYNEYAVFIDEINRGNISEIFGELITLIEIDKRLKMPNELSVILPYSKEEFGVPKNVSIYGTMNSADRSITHMDVALRRRFKFVSLTSSLQTLQEVLGEKGFNPTDIDGINLIKMLEVINKRIEILLNENFVIGHAYFLGVSSFEDIKDILLKKIIPLLEEYFFDDLEKVQMVLNDLDEYGELRPNAIYCHEKLEVSNLFEYQGEYEMDNKKRYYVSSSITVDSITKIYLM